jgi:hypothetical protein
MAVTFARKRARKQGPALPVMVDEIFPFIFRSGGTFHE